MKEKRELYYIAALVDGEIKDSTEENKLRAQIENNPELQFEYYVQRSIKTLVSERLKLNPAPAKVRKKLERKISPEYKSRFVFNFLPEIFISRPLIVWGSSIVLVLAVILIILNRTPQSEYKNFVLEQSGSDNMFIQARQNFEKILTGKLTPQIASDNPEKIKKFFTEQGVSYPTYIPEINGWKLIGAVVSEDHGKKFAHHVYSTENGKLVYLFQVDEEDIKKYNYLTLTKDLISYLDSGNCYESTENGRVTLMTKLNKNILAVVSNSSKDEIENNLCQIN
jgi:predicted DNA binding CopG/RHH family protein